MKDEIAVASRWIIDNIVEREDLPTESLVLFENQVQALLEERFKGHWYEREPFRGQAFRAVIVDEHSTDRLIVNAAEKSGIVDLERRLRRRWMLWVDPGEVEVKDEITNQRTLLYKRDIAFSSSSPSKHHSKPHSASIYSSYPVTSSAWTPSPTNARSSRATSPPRSTLAYNVNSKQFVPNNNNSASVFAPGLNFDSYSPQQKTILRRPSPPRGTNEDSLDYSYASPRPEMSVSSQA